MKLVFLSLYSRLVRLIFTNKHDFYSNLFQLTLKYLYNDLLFTPVVDNDFLTDIPIEIVKRNEFANVPTLMGTNRDEGTLIALRAYPIHLLRSYPPHMSLDDFREKLPDYLYYNDPMVVSASEQWYIDWTQVDNASASHIDAFINVNTDQVRDMIWSVFGRLLTIIPH